MILSKEERGREGVGHYFGGHLNFKIGYLVFREWAPPTTPLSSQSHIGESFGTRDSKSCFIENALNNKKTLFFAESPYSPTDHPYIIFFLLNPATHWTKLKIERFGSNLSTDVIDIQNHLYKNVFLKDWADHSLFSSFQTTFCRKICNAVSILFIFTVCNCLHERLIKDR